MSKLVRYVKESYVELVQKVSWPTMAELQNSAIVVFVSTLVIALVVFLMDFIVGINTGTFKGILGYIYSFM